MAAIDQFVLGVDLDGCVCDYYDAMRDAAAKWLGKDVATLSNRPRYGLPEWLDGDERYDELHRWAVTQGEFFARMRPIDGAGPSLRRLSRMKERTRSGVERPAMRIRVITHRLFVEHCHKVSVEQTVDWLDRWDIPYWDLCFIRDKGHVDANLYIEDAPHNIEALQEAGCDVITFDNSTNQDVDAKRRATTWAEVEKMVHEVHDDWRCRPEE